MVEIKWLREAKDDLNDIFEYISRDSERYALRQVEKIFEKSLTLKSHIRSRKIVEEINKPEIREIVEGNYRIIYRIINESEINILMVHHGARDISKRI